MSPAEAARATAEHYREWSVLTAYDTGPSSYTYEVLADAFEKFAEVLETEEPSDD